MKLRIYKTNNRYAFTVGGFSSVHHSMLVPEIESTYQYAWKAYKTAKDLIRDKKFHVEAMQNKRYAIEDLSEPVRADEPAEDILINHYRYMLQETSKSVKGIDDNSEEERKMTYLMIKSQVEDLLRIKDSVEKDKYKAKVDQLINGYRKIVQEHFAQYLAKDKEESEAAKDMSDEMSQAGMEGGEQMAQTPPMAPQEGQPMDQNLTMASVKRNEIFTEDELSELLEHYGALSCSAIAKNHPDAIYKISSNDSSFEILGIERESKPILKITINGNMQVNNIIPMGEIAEFLPAYSSRFYQRYWKPIIEAVGHFCVDEFDALILPEKTSLPDMAEDEKECKVRGWDATAGKEIPLSVQFRKNCMWSISSVNKIIKTAEYSEEDFTSTQPTRVQCIDQRLKLFGNIGEVVQIIPINRGIGFEIDVDFGRKIVRLTKDQVKIVDEL